MQIRKLKLTNFRSHRDTELHLGRMNLIIGPNASGKSSLVMAIEYALCGHVLTHMTDAAGKGAADLIAAGAAQFIIEAVLDCGLKDEDLGIPAPLTLYARRDKSQGGVILEGLGNKLAGATAREWVWSHVAPREQLRAVLDSAAFADMIYTERRELFARVLMPAKLDIPEHITLALKAIGFNAPQGAYGSALAYCEAAHKAAYDKRTEVNRDIKRLDAMTMPETEEGMPARHIVENQIQQLETRLRAKEREKTQAIDHAESARHLLLRAEADRKAADVKILNDAAIESHRVTLQNKLEIKGLEDAIDSKRGALTKWADTIAGFDEDRNCGECGRPMPTLEPEQRENIKAKYVELQAELEKLLAKRKKFGDPDHAEAQMLVHRKALADVTRLEKAIQEAKAAAVEVDPKPFDDAIAELTKRLAAGREVLTRVATAAGAAQAWNDSRADLANARSTLAQLERILAFFGDDGPARAHTAGDKAADFWKRLNQVLEGFGYACRYNDPHVAVDRLDGNAALNFEQLSESEQLRFTVALQIALAEITGVRLVIVDRADMLDFQSRAMLTQALAGAQLDQAILLATSGVVNVPDGVTCYHLDGSNGVTQAKRVYAQEEDFADGEI